MLISVKGVGGFSSVCEGVSVMPSLYTEQRIDRASFDRSRCRACRDMTNETLTPAQVAEINADIDANDAADDANGAFEKMAAQQADEVDAHEDDTEEECDDEDLGDDYDDSMDGDHESGLASAGFGTDEDYGCFGGNDD